MWVNITKCSAYINIILLAKHLNKHKNTIKGNAIHTIIHKQGCHAHVQTFKLKLIAYEKWKHIEYTTQYI